MVSCFSRPFYNVHLWSALQCKAVKHLNTTYMRVLRRMAGSCRFSSDAESDVRVRGTLGAPSIECIFRAKRLLYVARLARTGPRSLKALLSSTSGITGMPWSQLVLADLSALRMSCPARFAEMPAPAFDSGPWMDLMIEFPTEWKAIVKQYHFPSSVYDDGPTSRQPLPGAPTFSCSLCIGASCVFSSSKALASHMRTKHGIRNIFRMYVDSSGKCPVCETVLHTRLRVIAHLSDPRRNTMCREAICGGTVAQLSLDEVARLDALDTELRRNAQRAGLSHPTAVTSARRANGAKCGRPATL